MNTKIRLIPFPAPIKQPRGYIALMTAMILSTILITLSIASAETAFVSKAIFDSRSTHQYARNHADDCARAALFFYAKDSSYTVSSSTKLILADGDLCSIKSVAPDSAGISIISSGNAGLVTSSVSVKAVPTSTNGGLSYTYRSWVEIPAL